MTLANNQPHEVASAAKEKLPSPHFDETAVATAHPVQPLPSRSLSNWRRPALMIAVAVVAFISVVALAASWVVGSHGSVRVDDSKAIQATPSPEATPTPALTLRDEGSQITHVQPKLRSRRRNSEITRTVVVKEQAKPVARRVGVITDSHSRSRVQP